MWNKKGALYTIHSIQYRFLSAIFSISPVHCSSFIAPYNSVWSFEKHKKKISVSNGNISSMMPIAMWIFFLSFVWLKIHFGSNTGIICFIFDLLSAKSFSHFVTKANVRLYKHIEKSTIGMQVKNRNGSHIDEAGWSSWTLVFWMKIIFGREVYEKFWRKKIDLKWIALCKLQKIRKQKKCLQMNDRNEKFRIYIFPEMKFFFKNLAPCIPCF